MNSDLSNNRWRVRPIAIVAALVLAAGLLGFILARNVRADEPQNRTRAATAGPTVPSAQLEKRTTVLADLEDAFTAIAERMEPSVVSIRVKRTVRTTSSMPDIEDFFRGFPGFPDLDDLPNLRRMPRSFSTYGAGSGVIVRADGWILTNDHVVGGADKVTVKLHDGRELDGTVRRDFRSDLALVKIDASNLIPAELGDSDKVRVGQWAIAFGSPFQLSDTMTVGIISARHRQQGIGFGRQGRFYPSLIQTDAAINPGNSGGPLVDIRGRVIGINVAISSPTGGNVGIGFAIPANTAREVMNQLITRGKVVRGFLGVYPRALTPEEARRYGVKEGALIAQVSEGTPADRAGLQVEDVIVRFDGKPVKDDVALREIVARTAPGKKVDIVVRRNNREQTLTATLDTARDEPVPAQEEPAEERGGKLGVRVEAITPETVRKFNLSDRATGVVVVDVVSGSPADEAGLQPGDVIVRANGRDIRTEADLKALADGLKSGDTANLVVHRDKTRTLVTVRMP